jgi:putative hydrolase of HD superfamily
MTDERLTRQLAFLREIDQLKTVVRQSPLLDRSRRENSAEHSWHLAMYACILHEYAAGGVDVARVIRMLLLHDIVEVEAGDTPMHGGGAAAEQAEREERAAQHLFGMVPQPQGGELLALWREFEAAQSEDARFAKALDRFQPLLVNVFTGGGTWNENGVSLEQVRARCGCGRCARSGSSGTSGRGEAREVGVTPAKAGVQSPWRRDEGPGYRLSPV